MSTETCTLSVPDISCDHCKRAIEEHITPVDGVQAVSVDVAAKTVTVHGGEAGDIRAAIRSAGYATD